MNQKNKRIPSKKTGFLTAIAVIYTIILGFCPPLRGLDSLCPDGTAWPAPDDAEKHCPGQHRMGMLMYECRTTGQGFWKRSVAEQVCPMPPMHRAGRTMIPQRDIEFMGAPTPPLEERPLYYMQTPDKGGPERVRGEFDYNNPDYIPSASEEQSLLRAPSMIDFE